MKLPLRHAAALALIAATALAGCAAPKTAPTAGNAGTFTFGLWGDMPYQRNGDGPKMAPLLASINASDIAFSIYDGDIKDGSSRCDDKVYDEALAMFNAMERPTVYVPGDNEWTDCHRANNGGFNALERLEFLRKKLFAAPGSLGKTRMATQAQGQPGQPYAENQRFTHQGVVFVTLNIPGSNNNLVMSAAECSSKSVRKAADCDAANAEFMARDEANVRWLKDSFAQARASKAPGVVVVFQGDPGFDLPETESVNESQAASSSGYRHFMTELAAETAQYAGQVLMVHGDTHYFKLDMPLHAPGKLLPNFTRLQTFGSPSVHWVRVSVDPANPRVFSIQPVIVR